MKYTVFFNKDCCKYGVQDEQGRQVLICKHIDETISQCFCYSKYKAVAEKHAKKLNLGYYFVFSYGNKKIKGNANDTKTN